MNNAEIIAALNELTEGGLSVSLRGLIMPVDDRLVEIPLTPVQMMAIGAALMVHADAVDGPISAATMALHIADARGSA